MFCFRIWWKICAQMIQCLEKYLADAKKFVCCVRFLCRAPRSRKVWMSSIFKQVFLCGFFLYDCHSMCSQHAIHYYSLFSTDKQNKKNAVISTNLFRKRGKNMYKTNIWYVRGLYCSVLAALFNNNFIKSFLMWFFSMVVVVGMETDFKLCDPTNCKMWNTRSIYEYELCDNPDTVRNNFNWPNIIRMWFWLAVLPHTE